MESTGVYWKPVYNLLEDTFSVYVVNAHHIKAVPGRKTDVKDAEWIAELLQHGLLQPSFIPDRPQRELRELVRYRQSLVQERSREVNRLAKVLEGANIKFGLGGHGYPGGFGQADAARPGCAVNRTPRCWRRWPRVGCAASWLSCKKPFRVSSGSHQRFLLGVQLRHLEALEEEIVQTRRRGSPARRAA